MQRLKQVFRLEGDYWTIAFDGQVIRLKDSKGLRYLSTLLRHPGRKLPAMALVAPNGRASPPVPDDRRTERARLTVTKGIKSALDRIAAAHPTLGEHLAVTVRRGYACAYTPDPRYPSSWEE